MRTFPMLLRKDGRRFGLFGVAFAGRLRDMLAQQVWKSPRHAFGGALISLTDATVKVNTQTRTDPAQGKAGHIALVGAGPGARDLLTLRALQRLQEADVIFYDRLVDPDLLDLAREGAQRIYVGKELGTAAWSQARIDRMIVAEAARGKRVVRLKSGDPSIFGRATEEIDAARAAGIAVEIVPGITAASAAAAATCHALTERGETDTFVITTGTCRPGDAEPDRALLARPGTAIAFYMSVEKAAKVQADLLAAGAPTTCPVEIIASVSTPRERRVETVLADLAETVRENGIVNPAILMVRYPKSLARDIASKTRSAA
ncbi:uroporphyrin-III C-methyltransferase/precorrin-2 dehydrogenase/sirohydrochlorin ferrochelatase/uroporphyrin-III C-methyltransferase [Rhodobacter aestuarii]|uniref:uroporphyrinogen-III C-methyltransferase n=1 Tax=Rhodobacter aestuarii TaxID=453582 RepID=A0A1N7PWI8_9RHOB|nr:uroporphyrinogen-III C-methyltransferase [Rhodobacter aestuarii]PTV94111.1 uroporphyrin-III C-methyltransferase/precorrin-2 dehydrogenase/sirohydrochlorin ferrochelatase/uroporphyrin-III C-methyltransferase [Rhodobacter aestuarii]SIT14932.1 uroporphyrin-III C-methyltransferase / precorrin-2 dehydrogenase / sirohydrochlorin ferrochelatase/uroporphyrin-III C-methyltransferase [Rhodobacter aestuarii]